MGTWSTWNGAYAVFYFSYTKVFISSSNCSAASLDTLCVRWKPNDIEGVIASYVDNREKKMAPHLSHGTMKMSSVKTFSAVRNLGTVLGNGRVQWCLRAGYRHLVVSTCLFHTCRQPTGQTGFQWSCFPAQSGVKPSIFRMPSILLPGLGLSGFSALYYAYVV